MEYEHLEVDGIKFRCVNPYEHVYTTWCKERWRNKPLLEVFLRDFKAYSKRYYTNAIENGSILINGIRADHEYIIKNGDCITHATTRCEPPVLDIPIGIVYDLPNILVVNKPSSIPVHPSGAYSKNSLIYILEHEHGFKDLRLIHRLDRVTSGIVIMAKTMSIARALTDLLQSHSTEKWYVARVKGRFAYEEIEVKAGISCKCHKDGIYQIDPQGKASHTYFKIKFYDEASDQSVVLCRPFTGRTHQIRLHLMHIGFPIANDTCYGGDMLNPITTPEIKFKHAIEDFQVPLENIKQLEIWLHAWRYKLTQNLDFKVPLPKWAEI